MTAAFYTSSDLDERSAESAAVDERREGARQIGKGDRAGDDAGEMARRKIRRDALPHRKAQRARRRRGVDAEEVHAAQDEGHDRGLKLRSAGHTDARNIAVKADR